MEEDRTCDIYIYIKSVSVIITVPAYQMTWLLQSVCASVPSSLPSVCVIIQHASPCYNLNLNNFMFPFPHIDKCSMRSISTYTLLTTLIDTFNLFSEGSLSALSIAYLPSKLSNDTAKIYSHQQSKQVTSEL